MTELTTGILEDAINLVKSIEHEELPNAIVVHPDDWDDGVLVSEPGHYRFLGIPVFLSRFLDRKTMLYTYASGKVKVVTGE